MASRPGPLRPTPGALLPDTPLRLEPVPACPACGAPERTAYRTTRAMMHAAAERFSFSRCTACTLVYLDPRVAPEHLGRFYGPEYLPYRGPEAWGRWAPFVAASLRRTDRARVSRVRRTTALAPESRVLDVGCGRPTFLEALHAAVACTAVGADFSDHGWRDDPTRWAPLELHQGELSALDLPGPFDVITMWHYLEHDYAPLDTLRRLRALSHVHTRLLIEVPDHDAWSRRRYGDQWAGYHTPRHTALYDAKSLGGLLERAGWATESVTPRGTLDPWTLVWMSRQERRGIDWSGDMAGRFLGFAAGRALLWPALAVCERVRRGGGSGFLTAVARPA